MSDSTLTINPDSRSIEQREWAWSQIRALEKHAGSTPGLAWPALIGGIAGTLVGGIAGYASGPDECSGQELCFERGGTAFLGGIVGLAAGVSVGFAFGIMIQRDVWEPVEIR